MRQGHKIWISRKLETLDFVNWDRFTEGGNKVTFYGWIERDDEYKDFAVLRFHLLTHMVELVATSSARHSEEIAEKLLMRHDDCKRVEASFDIENCVRLGHGVERKS